MTEEKIDLEGNIDLGEPEDTLPTKSKLMALSLSNISAREWLSQRRAGIQPWAQFLNYKQFKTPKTVAPIGKRVLKNIERFQSNYLFVFIGLVVFCILTSPLLLVAIAACLGACYIIRIRNADNPLKIAGKELTVAQQYGAVGAMSFPLFWLAGAGGAVFWVIGASFFTIMLHASMYALEDEAEPFDLEMETV